MRIEEVIRKVKEVLDEKDSLREEALQITREIVRLSGDSIKAMHRGELKTAEERLRRAGELVSLLREKLGNHPDLYYTGHVQTANQEFTEATLLYHYLTDKNFPGYEDLGVPPQDYILGVGDFIGELRRYFLISLMEGDIERAEETYRFMEEVYEELMTLEYPKGLVNVRQKQDQARYILERTLEDLTRAKLNMKLERKLEEAINVGESGKSSREAE
ncbi:haloacid dehalogenase [Thermococcus chitonophagus]|nr:haloacid dehalogenase [Thermococcus chitonophagus]ASJ16645.1 haloacid dehalogenase [Thermococcus chitonophagus]